MIQSERDRQIRKPLLGQLRYELGTLIEAGVLLNGRKMYVWRLGSAHGHLSQEPWVPEFVSLEVCGCSETDV